MTRARALAAALAAALPSGALAATLSLSPPAQPAAATVAAGGSAVVGKVSLSSSAGTISVLSLSVASSGTALPGSDVLRLLLFDDTSGGYLGASAWNGTAWSFQGLGIQVTSPTVATVRVVLVAARGGAPGATFAMSVSAAGVQVDSPNVASGGPVTGNAFTVGAGPVAGSADARAPMVLVLNPGDGAQVTGPRFRVQVQVHNPAGLPALSSVQVSSDGGGTWTAIAQNARYAAGANAGIFEGTLNLGPGAYTLVAQASNTVPLTARSPTATITVAPAVKGDGYGLVRDDSSQLCTDCHALKTHSSQTTSRQYGAWGASCRDCHAPHSTRNTFLVRQQIAPPPVNGYQASRPAYLAAQTGDSNATISSANFGSASYANADGSGPCQVCHTRTKNPTSGAARWRSSGNADTHYTAAAGTRTCTDCHVHSNGFAGESNGGIPCASCHGAIWQGMNGTVAKASKHAIGAVAGTNDSFTDSGIAWANPLSGNAAAARSCVNMCHDDHPHTLASPATATHENNVYLDAGTSTSRAATTTTSADKDKTDYEKTAANGGLCTSCHRNPVDAKRPAVDPAAYGAGAHAGATTASGATVYAWQYTQHDGSTFQRDCTKCHADRNDSQPGDATTPFGAVHYSDYPSLLAGSTNPAGAPATFVCYGCHGNGTTGQNLSGKDVATQMARASSHPSNADAVHDSVGESTGAAWGNMLSTGKRHASCIDCHEPHRTKAGVHTPGSSVAGGALDSAWGVQLTPPATAWTLATSASFTKKTLAAGTDLEGWLCFKCHTNFYWGDATSPGRGVPSALPSGPSYATGTATFAAGSTAVTGSGTAWAATMVGWVIKNNADGTWYLVTAVASATSLTISPAPPAAMSGAYTMNLGDTDTAREFNPNNPRFHAVLGAPKTSGKGTYVNGWTATSRITCSDCHGSGQAGEPSGPHGTPYTYNLKASWSANTGKANTQNDLCFRCHDYAVYGDAAQTTGWTANNSAAATGYSNSSQGNLHNFHMSRGTVYCENCHGTIPHGWNNVYPVWTQQDSAPWNLNATLQKSEMSVLNRTSNWQESNCSAAHSTGCG